jgi:hypothetical protein
MCGAPVFKEGFRDFLKKHKVRFYRVKRDRRAYNKWAKKAEFFVRHAKLFDTAVWFDKDKKVFKFKYLKVEEGEENNTRSVLCSVEFIRQYDPSFGRQGYTTAAPA